ncbi:MAG TPA: hypothetical protein VIC84_06835 [Blastocatellia bacterium]|jgi:hypothetical protein
MHTEESKLDEQIGSVNNLLAQSRQEAPFIHGSKEIQLHADGLVTRPGEEKAKLYPLDQESITVKIRAGKFTLEHILRRPTLLQLNEREKELSVQTEEVVPGENRLINDDEESNAKLWDKLIIAVKGYQYDGVAADIWLQWTPTIAATLGELIPDTHKSEAVRGLYQTKFEIERPKDEEEQGFALGATTHTIIQKIGAFEIRHYLTAPKEGQRREARKKFSETRYMGNAGNFRTKVLTYLQPYVDFYDKLFMGIGGATLGGMCYGHISQRADFLAAIDPIYKRGAIDALMKSYNVALSD